MLRNFVFLMSCIGVLQAYPLPIKSILSVREIIGCGVEQSPLPEGLVAVEFLENTNATCHVATPLRFCDVPSSAICLIYSIAPNATIVNRTIYGRQISSNAGYYNLQIGSYALKYQLGTATTISFGSYDIHGAKVMVELDMLHNVVKVNGSLINVDVAARWETVREALRSSTAAVFLYRDNARAPVLGLRIHGFKGWVNDELLCDLVPVRFKNETDEWEGAFYDFVSGDLFKASNSKLVIGPDK